MSLSCEETHREFLEGDNASAVIRYIIQGTTSDLIAKQTLRLASPTTNDGLVRQSVHVDENEPGCGIWHGRVTYGLYQLEPETGQSTYQFDTGGGSQHITQSINTVGSYVATGNAPDYKGAIGVTKDTVEGVDIQVPVFHWMETHYIPAYMVDQSYKIKLSNLTGTVNSLPFRGFAAGEVIFQGAAGNYREGQDDWEITYSFAASPNQQNITIGDITGIDKKGWEYLWARYEDTEDATAKALVKKPTAVYVEQVYPYSDFYELGIS